MEFLSAAGFVTLIAIAAAAWLLVGSGVKHLFATNTHWTTTDTVVWLLVFLVAVASTAGVLIW